MKSKIDYKEIKKLIDLIKEKNLSNFEIEVEGLRIKISRTIPQTQIKKNAPAVSESAEAGQQPEPPETKPRDDLHYITSPMVGTFYRAPDPSSPPFAEIGDLVNKNQTLCIIEAMKLMNEIESDIDGVIEEIFIKNGKSVEYGQNLFSIKTK
jgi:acetyl-CoA carboxylase biotin carboxyl carrier protein